MAATAKQAEKEIENLVATLASRQAANTGPKARALTGPERAAVLMLALGEQYGGKIWSLLDVVGRLSASGAIMGNYDATERLLHQYLPPERVSGIMDEIRGPAGRNMWEKLSNVQEEVLANYLKNEYPQTIAVVLSKLKPEH